LLDENVPIQKRLLMTATPRHYDINRDNMGEARLLFSMDNETLYGKRAYTLSFRRAMELDVIVNYKVVISITESKDNHQEPEIEEKIVALQKAVKKISAVSKIITFHKTIEEAHHFSKHIQDNEKMTHFKSFHVSSLIPSQMRKSAMQQFECSKHAIVTNARCLTEGIDAPAVDMVAFLNKKRSKIDIIQAIGRALRKSPQKTYGYVFLPLFVQKLKGESLEKAVDRADYREIWEVLQALSEYDESLEATIQQLSQERGQTGAISNGLEDYLEIIAHDTVSISLQKKLAKKIDILIVKKLGNRWDELYGKLLKFKEKHHHCNVPQRFLQDPPLGSWVQNQRNFYKKRQLPSSKIQQLEAIGFEWDPNNHQWQQMFDKLTRFKKEHYHCNVPYIFLQDPTLGPWINTQRTAYKKRQLPSSKIQQLEVIGFEWDPNNHQWQKMFDKLAQFKKEQNHCNVSRGFLQDPTLASWVNNQRQAYKRGQLSSHKIQQLEAIGFEWILRNN
jgi:superfamily II DNA/RNA helicase